MRPYKEVSLIMAVFLLFVGIFIWGIVFLTAPAKQHDHLLYSKCKDICAPYETILCHDITSKYWTPEYIDAIVVCNGTEIKRVAFIKEPK